MESGCGVTLDNSDQVAGFFGNKSPVFGVNLSPRTTNSSSSNNLINMFPVSSTGEGRSSELDFFAVKKRSVAVKKETDCSQPQGSNCREFDVNIGLQLVTANTGSDQSTVEDEMSNDDEDKRAKIELAQLQAELERMNAENERLKGMLNQVTSNYSSLQMHFVTLIQHQQNSITTQEHRIVDRKSDEKQIVPRQFLELGPNEQSNSISEERTVSVSGSPRKNNTEILSRNKRIVREESPESEGWAPQKAAKLNNPSPKPVVEEATMRKARVSVRARSEAPMISDGCQWRKYGQKMAKGNPCPRAYYRCTMAVGCPVRKQVQRCAEDRTILITTYEGTHNHPLPPAAMAMASTTSAAANMLLSGSMSSTDGIMNPNFLARTILPCSSSMATISASAPFPTVTLDLTQTPTPMQLPEGPAQFRTPFPQGFPAMQAAPAPQYNQSRFSGLQMSRANGIIANAAQFHGHPPPMFAADTLSAATAAITADPNFTAALAAAISSIIGGGSTHQTNNNENTIDSGKTSFPGN